MRFASQLGRTLAAGFLVCGFGSVLALVGCSDDPACAHPDAGVKPADLRMPTLVEQGQALVATYGCANCHEPTGKKGGVLSGQTNPVGTSMAYGANLTPDHATGVGDWSDADLTSAIRDGVDDAGEMLCPTMPRFKTLKDDEVTAIIAYLRSLPAVNQTVPDSMCPPIKPPPPATDGGVHD
jgi:mono/diheme cytochrome c family protein